jgi:DNA ligase-1
MSLQKISGLARGYTPGESEKLQYWIYDVAEEGLPYEKRFEQLDGWFDGDTEGPLVKVPTLTATAHEDVQKAHDEWVKLGFEGAIVRANDCLYRLGLYRSGDLLKFKEFIDHEFEIIGGKEAEGTQEGCVTFKVRGAAIDRDRKQGPVVEFDVNPRGSLEQRRVWMAELSSLTGKKITVRYFNLTDDGVPTFPVGIVIRDYE